MNAVQGLTLRLQMSWALRPLSPQHLNRSRYISIVWNEPFIIFNLNCNILQTSHSLGSCGETSGPSLGHTLWYTLHLLLVTWYTLPALINHSSTKTCWKGEANKSTFTWNHLDNIRQQNLVMWKLAAGAALLPKQHCSAMFYPQTPPTTLGLDILGHAWPFGHLAMARGRSGVPEIGNFFRSLPVNWGWWNQENNMTLFHLQWSSPTHIFWHAFRAFFSHIFQRFIWHSIWRIFNVFWQFYLTYSDMASGILGDIFSDIPKLTVFNMCRRISSELLPKHAKTS